MGKKTALRVVAGGIVFIVIVGLWEIAQNTIVVVNGSGMRAQEVDVSVCGICYKFGEIGSGKSKTRRFDSSNDGHFSVFILLSDHTVLSTNFGYVTCGLYGERTKILITKDKEIVGRQE